MTLTAATGSDDFIRELAAGDSARLVRAELARRWPDSVDPLAAMTRYALLPAGKLIRPVLALECALAVGGRAVDVLPAVLGLEYLHAATLVHDDIVDGDPVRRGRSSVPARYGVSAALLTGDHLVFAAFEALAGGAAAERAGPVVTVLARCGADLCRGQVLESGLVGDPAVGAERYLEVVRLKTGALFRAGCEIGALLGGADPATTAGLAAYGEDLGAAFQIRDDLLPYGENPSGKPATSDLANRRPTLPLLLAHESADPADRDLLAAALGPGAADEAELGRVRAVLERTGALHRAARHGVRRAERATTRLPSGVDGGGTALLGRIAGWLCSALAR
jgi:geranylgeranyl diphosphate synthase type I